MVDADLVVNWGRPLRAREKTEARCPITRGSRDGMYRKNNSTMRETQYGDGAEPSTSGYKDYRKSIGLYWESEGFIVPFEDRGQHNP